MRVLAFFALLAAPALAFVPRMPAPVRARASLTLRFSGEYSEKVRRAYPSLLPSLPPSSPSYLPGRKRPPKGPERTLSMVPGSKSTSTHRGT